MKRLFLLIVIYHLSFIYAVAQRIDNPENPSKYIVAVDEYRPAPGQYINDLPEYNAGDTEQDMIRKCTESLADNARQLVALGAFGGYITFHFDHSIANVQGQRDFAIWGNAYQEELNLFPGGGTGEAGVVMVSKDVNGNGLPDDPWYEIKGSCDEDSVGKVDYGYEITYRRNPMGKIPWTDNRGHSGELDRWNRYHPQEYYPEWLEDGLTFRGTRLPQNGFDFTGSVPSSYSAYFWVLFFFGWGYADNQPNTLSDRETPNIDGCGIDISWAVDDDRTPVQLDFIDFVRVYTGLNQKCGWLLETSTEILGAEDLHLDASLQASREAADIKGVYDLPNDDAPVYKLNSRIYIKNGKKYFIK
jgi:hypothetical protein